MKSFRQMTKVFKALANEKRLKILGLLLQYRELNVSDIAYQLKMPITTTSRHLDKLRSLDLVEFRQQGLQNYYSVSFANREQIRDIFRII